MKDRVTLFFFLSFLFFIFEIILYIFQYGEKTFDVWDFKKAILNTVIQALKAISGGVLALKGQLIKGGGFLVSTKGKIISTTGDAISSLGRHIAASAVIQPPKPHYGQPSYGYDHRPIGKQINSFD